MDRYSKKAPIDGMIASSHPQKSCPSIRRVSTKNRNSPVYQSTFRPSRSPLSAESGLFVRSSCCVEPLASPTERSRWTSWEVNRMKFPATR